MQLLRHRIVRGIRFRMALHAAHLARKYGLLAILVSGDPFGRFRVAFQTVAVTIRMTQLQRKMKRMRVVAVNVNHALLFGLQRAGHAVGRMAVITLVLRNVPVGVVHGRQAVALRIFHIVHVRFHGQVARAAELHGFGPLEDQEIPDAGQNHRKQGRARDQQGPRGGSRIDAAVAEETEEHQRDAEHDHDREKPRAVVIHRVLLERALLRARYQRETRPATQRHESQQQAAPSLAGNVVLGASRRHAFLAGKMRLAFGRRRESR